MALHRLIVIALTTTLGFSGATAWAIGDKSCTADADASFIDVLRAKVQSERLYSAWAKEQCLSFSPEHCDTNVVEVAIRELHTDECGGDPNTAPIVDRFRVFKQSFKIEWFDHVEAEYVEFDKVQAHIGQ